MTPFQLFWAKIFLRKALQSPCPNLIPRSGVAGERMSCFSIYADNAGEPYLLVNGLSGDVLSCLKWDGDRFKLPVDVPLSAIESRDISIIHAYGLNDIAFRGILDFAVRSTLRLPYLKFRIVRAIETMDQYFFNKKKLMTKQRIELLRFLIDQALDGNSVHSTTGLMTGLYSIKWVRHPEKDQQHKRLCFYLDSLVGSGELTKESGGYRVTGVALKAIEVYEEQERKHTENVKVQRKIMWLTLAIALLTAAQAGLFKLPTLVDLSGWQW